MPITQIQLPILQFFFCAVESQTGMPPQPLDATPSQLAQAQQKQNNNDRPKQIPKGVVLGPDGKPYVGARHTESERVANDVQDAAHAHPSPTGQR